MGQLVKWCAVAVGILAFGGLAASGQAAAPAMGPGSPASAQALPAAPEAQAGGRLHGVVKSGNTPLPGVTVTAQNTLTGKRYTTTTDITGVWSMRIPQDGRYVVRTEFAAFAGSSQEALLNTTGRDRTLDFELMLASRAAAQELQQAQQQAGQAGQPGTEAQQAIQQGIQQGIQQLTGNGAESLSLMSDLSAGTDTSSGVAGVSGAELPSIAGNSDFSDESVAVSGQSGQVSPLAGVDMDALRQRMEEMRAQNGGQGGLFGGGPGGGGFGGGFGGPGGFGGRGGGFGGRGGGRGNFRGFNPGQPHGAVFWTGSNSALNAQPFSLRGQSQNQPASGTNRFGITFMSAPYLPGLTKPSGKDTLFLSLSGQRRSNPLDEYATVPTLAERGGDFSASGLQPIYDPTTQQQFVTNGTANVIPSNRITSQAAALLQYFPQPNLPGTVQNYHLLSTAQSNSTQAGIRYMRALGKNATLMGGRRGFGGGGGRRTQTGLRQSINFNYNWAHSASDNVNIFPELGGKSSTNSYSLQAGYTVGYNRFTNIFNVNWNRSDSQVRNFFTSGADIATQIGVLGPGGAALNTSALNYGLPNVTLSTITGLSQQQPNLSISQTISASEVVSWRVGKHNLRFGGDYRRVHRDFLGGSNATGSFTFTGLFTQDASGSAKTGSPVADLLLGLPQSTSIDSSVAKSYLRDNVLDAYAMDDWRVSSQLTLNLGIRYEFYAPYTEKYGHLAFVDTNPADGFTGQVQVQAGGTGAFSGKLPAGLVFPYRTAFAPRLAFAWRVPRLKQTVVRGGYGMNYTVGAYGSFATTMAHQPPFANQQTNQEIDAQGNATSACARGGSSGCFTLADGFPAPATTGNFALDPHYPLPYVQVWNLDLQRTLPWGIVMNLGYNGSRGSRLDSVSAPRATPSSPNTDPQNLVFRYEQAAAYSKFNAGTVRLNKRLSGGLSLGANYQYAHSIDDAGALGSVGGVGVQNWQDVRGEEGNSSIDVRHRVTGNYLYELPFGQDKPWVTSGAASHVLEGFSVSGSFTFATGTPLSPYYEAAVQSVACGTGGTFRPDLNPGVSVTAGGGTLRRWFNPAAYSAPGVNAQYPCGVFGNTPRNSIQGPGTVQNNMALSKTMQLGDTRSMEIRATASNVFNTVQYAGVDTNVASPTFGQVTRTGSMRAFDFVARFRF